LGLLSPNQKSLSPFSLFHFNFGPMTFREMERRDIGRCIEVRTLVRENRYSLAALQREGITEESVARMLATTHKGWICELEDQIVGFSMGDQNTGEFFVVACCRNTKDVGSAGS
jgi:hypothetical protein